MSIYTTCESLTPLTVHPTASPNPATVAASVTFTPNVLGDILPYTYQWQFDQDTLWDDLVHAWSLDEPSGTRFDCLGAKNLTEYGTVGPAAGAYGDAADFTSGYLSNPAGTLVTTNFTVSLWFKVPTTATNPVLFYQPGQCLFMLVAKHPYLEVNAWSGGAKNAWMTADTVDDGNWHHYLGWVDTSVDMFIHSSIDGGATFDGAAALSGVLTPVSPSAFYFGLGLGSGTPTGLFMQRVAWWNRALTAGEKTALYTGQFYGSGMEEPSYAYPASGDKVASVTVTSATGCTVTDTVDVTVNPTSTVEGTVTLDGLPWAGNISMTVDAVPWPGGVATTNGAGFYQFLLVPAGAIEVTCALGSNAGVTVPPATLVLNIASVS